MSKEKEESKLVRSLREYFENTPPEQLQKELADLEVWNQIGPDVIDYFKAFKGHRHQMKVLAAMRKEVPILEDSNLSEEDVRKVIGLFNESSEYFNKKIEEERDSDGGSELFIGACDGVIDVKELSIQYVLHKLNIKNG